MICIETVCFQAYIQGRCYGSVPLLPSINKNMSYLIHVLAVMVYCYRTEIRTEVESFVL